MGSRLYPNDLQTSSKARILTCNYCSSSSVMVRDPINNKTGSQHTKIRPQGKGTRTCVCCQRLRSQIEHNALRVSIQGLWPASRSVVPFPTIGLWLFDWLRVNHPRHYVACVWTMAIISRGGPYCLKQTRCLLSYTMGIRYTKWMLLSQATCVNLAEYAFDGFGAYSWATVDT